MSFNVKVAWQGYSQPGEAFSRDHQIQFGSGQALEASSAPDFKGSADKVNPEESLMAALSSCHMLTFLAIAHLKRLPVASYQDNVTAELGQNEAGKTKVAVIDLNPVITFVDGVEVSPEVLEKMHQKAHDNCFIANSLNTTVRLNGKEFTH
ncbi:OsmC family protein [Photobacterium sp. TLY01]|uniref:OsmC family protein n=1 Tax=Photobacterium sp. TLY01 TaxID=2907534 RepID=UPI001F215B2E|nr:OsmC family protein [Photobacterium sp. TLY01]UIP28974.1 OsmC family protein [Photobacterium sp. TLY01]